MPAPDSLMAMWPHFVSLLSRSWASFLHAMGTTGLGFFTPVLVFALTVILTLVVIFLRDGKEKMKEHWQETAAIASIATVAVMLIVYGPIFAWNIVKTVYVDHQDLVNKDKELLAKNSTLVDPASRDNQIASLKQQLETALRKEPPHRSSSASSEAPPLPPPIRDARIVSQEWVPSTNPKYKYELRVLVQTNVVIQPVSIVFECNALVEDGSVWFAGDAAEAFSKVRSGVILSNRKDYLASFEQPAFTPEKNMIVTLFSNEPIKVISFGEIPFRWP